MKRLAGKAVIVFGAATGIGAATVRRIVAEGGSVCLADINIDGARALATELAAIGHQAHAVYCDVSDAASVDNAVAEAVAHFGKLDSAHFNAADLKVIEKDHDLLQLELATFDRTIAVNLRGAVLCTKAVLPHLLKQQSSSIIYTSSGAWRHGEPTRPSYAMSKAAMNALMRHTATAWGKQGLRANCIAPGITPTPSSTANTGTEFEDQMLALVPHVRLGKPEDHAAVVALLLSEDGAWINGQVIDINGGQLLS